MFTLKGLFFSFAFMALFALWFYIALVDWELRNFGGLIFDALISLHCVYSIVNLWDLKIVRVKE